LVENNNFERLSNHGRKAVKSTVELAPRNSGKKRGIKKKNEILLECGKLMIDLGNMKGITSYSFTNL